MQGPLPMNKEEILSYEARLYREKNAVIKYLDLLPDDERKNEMRKANIKFKGIR